MARKKNDLIEILDLPFEKAKPKPFAETKQHEFERELFAENENHEIYLHNVSGGEFHIPVPPGFNHEQMSAYGSDPATRFSPNEVRGYSKTDIAGNLQLKSAIQANKLKIISPEDAVKIRDKVAKLVKEAANHTDSKKAGVHPGSGLPMNTRLAVGYIYDTENVDELETWAENDDREVILKNIEERLSQLDDAN